MFINLLYSFIILEVHCFREKFSDIKIKTNLHVFEVFPCLEYLLWPIHTPSIWPTYLLLSLIKVYLEKKLKTWYIDIMGKKFFLIRFYLRAIVFSCLRVFVLLFSSTFPSDVYILWLTPSLVRLSLDYLSYLPSSVS